MRNCWEELVCALREAEDFIYIVGWSMHPGTRLTRTGPSSADGETIGELLKQKAQDRVNVCLLVRAPHPHPVSVCAPIDTLTHARSQAEQLGQAIVSLAAASSVDASDWRSVATHIGTLVRTHDVVAYQTVISFWPQSLACFDAAQRCAIGSRHSPTPPRTITLPPPMHPFQSHLTAPIR